MVLWAVNEEKWKAKKTLMEKFVKGSCMAHTSLSSVAWGPKPLTTEAGMNFATDFGRDR